MSSKAQIIEEENKVFKDALEKGRITQEQYEEAMRLQRQRLAESQQVQPSKLTTEYLASKQFYEKIGYPEYGGLYAPIELSGYTVAGIKETSEGLQFSLYKKPEGQTGYTRPTQINNIPLEKAGPSKPKPVTPTITLSRIMQREMTPFIENFGKTVEQRLVSPERYVTPITGSPLTPEAHVKLLAEQQQETKTYKTDPLGYFVGKGLEGAGVVAVAVNPAAGFVAATVGAGGYAALSTALTGEFPEGKELKTAFFQTAGFAYGTELLFKGLATVPKIGKYAYTTLGKGAIMSGVGATTGYISSKGDVDEAVKYAVLAGGLTVGLELLPKGIKYVKGKMPVVTGWERESYGPEGWTFKEYKGVIGKSQIQPMPSFIREERMSQFLAQTSQASSYPVNVSATEQTVYGLGGKPYLAILKHQPTVEAGGLMILKQPTYELEKLASMKGNMLKFHIAPVLIGAYQTPATTTNLLSSMSMLTGSGVLYGTTKALSVPDVSQFVSSKSVSKFAPKLATKTAMSLGVSTVQVSSQKSAQIVEQVTGQVSQQKQAAIQKMAFPSMQKTVNVSPTLFPFSFGGGKGKREKGLRGKWIPRTHNVKTWEQQLKDFGLGLKGKSKKKGKRGGKKK